MASGVIEIVVFLGFVVPICWWQLHDLKKARRETARKRAQAAQKQAESAAQSDGDDER